MMPKKIATTAPNREAPDPSVTVTKAALNAARRLKLSNAALARVLGISPPSASRMKSGAFLLRDGDKPFELAVLFLRLFRSLDAIVGGDEEVARAWLRNDNAALGAAPLGLIQTIAGLTDVIAYLDARRARI